MCIAAEALLIASGCAEIHWSREPRLVFEGAGSRWMGMGGGPSRAESPGLLCVECVAPVGLCVAVGSGPSSSHRVPCPAVADAPAAVDGCEAMSGVGGAAARVLPG